MGTEQLDTNVTIGGYKGHKRIHGSHLQLNYSMGVAFLCVGMSMSCGFTTGHDHMSKGKSCTAATLTPTPGRTLSWRGELL